MKDIAKGKNKSLRFNASNLVGNLGATAGSPSNASNRGDGCLEHETDDLEEEWENEEEAQKEDGP